MSITVAPGTPARTRFSGLAWPTLVLVMQACSSLAAVAGEPQAREQRLLRPSRPGRNRSPRRPRRPTPRVSIRCSTSTAYSNYQKFTMDVGGDFAAIWTANPIACNANREYGPR